MDADPIPSRNHLAYGALDDLGRPYVVIKPVIDDPRLRREAYPLELGSLKTAEDIAEVFNTTGSYIFRGGLPLCGDSIPSLHRAACARALGALSREA